MSSKDTDGALDMGNKGDREIALTEYNHNGIVDEIFCEPPSLLNNYMSGPIAVPIIDLYQKSEL